jgi:hypothetical protein
LENGFALHNPDEVRDQDIIEYCHILLKSPTDSKSHIVHHAYEKKEFYRLGNGTDGSASDVGWHNGVSTIAELYGKYDAIGTLIKGLIYSIRLLVSDEISQMRAEQWVEAWSNEAVREHRLMVPLRLLRAAVAWKPNHDVRALLALAIEERRVLETLLKGKLTPETPEGQEDEDRS